MKEIEILVKIKDAVKDARRKLSHLKYKGMREMCDVYYHHPATKRCSPKSGFITECLRIRKKDKKVYLTYKLDHFDKNNTWTYSDEHEVEVNDLRAITEIITKLGFIPLAEIKSRKYAFLTKDYEVVIEDVENLGRFLEVECLNVGDNDKVEKKKEDIRGFIKKLGIDVVEEMTMGKLELMLKKSQQSKEKAIYSGRK